MNIKKSILLLTVALFIFLTGCKTVDPPPYLFSPKSLPTLEEQAIRKKEINTYVIEHPDLTNRQKALIKSGTIGEGLHKEHVLLLRNRTPDKIETDNLKYDADEMWFYREVNWNDYFYFRDDLLMKIDHRR